MGIHKTKKPMFSKEFIWPAKMIHITTDTLRKVGTAPDFFQKNRELSLLSLSLLSRKRAPGFLRNDIIRCLHVRIYQFRRIEQ